MAPGGWDLHFSSPLRVDFNGESSGVKQNLVLQLPFCLWDGSQLTSCLQVSVSLTVQWATLRCSCEGRRLAACEVPGVHPQNTGSCPHKPSVWGPPCLLPSSPLGGGGHMGWSPRTSCHVASHATPPPTRSPSCERNRACQAVCRVSTSCH
jgi:hypothetical protein